MIKHRLVYPAKVTLAAFSLAVFGSFAKASPGEEARIEQGRQQFASFASGSRELGEGEYFLVSLATAIRPQDFDELRGRYDMRALSIHFCTSDGVLRLSLKEAETAADRVGRTDLLESLGGRQRYISPVELGGDLTPNDPRLCGFEASMSPIDVKRFHSDNNANLLSIEIQNLKRRFYAVNHNLRIRRD